MSIVQVPLEIPDNLSVGLATGKLRRDGGVIRYAVGKNKGQIVKILKDSNEKQSIKHSTVEKIVDFGKNHKKTMVGTAVVAGTVIVGGGIAIGVNKHKKRRLQKLFRNYFEAIKDGCMTIKIINDLQGALSDVDTINLKTSELSFLINIVRDYTESLAKNNNVEIDVVEDETPVIVFEQYLNIQKSILEAA